MSANHYINSKDFHEELRQCKLADELSRRAIEYFYKLATNYSVSFFQNETDREDAVASAVSDCFKYWRNFKEGMVCRVHIKRNFKVGEGFEFNIVDDRAASKVVNIRLVAGVDFAIGDNAGRSLNAMIDVGTRTKKSAGEISPWLGIYLDRTRNNVTFMDIYNRHDLSIVSSLVVLGPEDLHECQSVRFAKPPNAFSYFTTVVRNGIFKFNNELNPPKDRDVKVIPMSTINRDRNGLYNL